MSLIRRAFLYVTRKRGKSMLLFFVIFVASSLGLCCLAALDAEEDASTELRGTTGSSFTVSRDTSTGGYSSDSGGTYSTQAFISQDMIEQIAAIEGIEAYDTSSTTILNLYDKSGNYYENVNPTGYADVDSQYYTNTSINSEYSSLFLSQVLTLVAGRHITDTDENVILISSEAADKNNLKVGDVIYAVIDPDSDPTTAVEIIGTFEANIDKTDEKNNYNMASYYEYENYAFTDIYAMEAVLTNYPGERPSDGYSSVDFFVSDPIMLENIIVEAQGISDIKWSNYTISVNDEVYTRVAASMSDMSTLIRILIIVSVIISMGIITLILAMWIKSRIHETGILIAAGISKISIMVQYFIEVGIIAAISYPAAYCFSSIVAGGIGTLAGQTSEVIVTISHLYRVSAAGCIILILAILISVMPVLRLKPKEILSKMS